LGRGVHTSRTPRRRGRAVAAWPAAGCGGRQTVPHRRGDRSPRTGGLGAARLPGPYDPSAVGIAGRRKPRPRRRQRSGGGEPPTPRPAGDRTLEQRIHPHARSRRSGRLPRLRSRGEEGSERFRHGSGLGQWADVDRGAVGGQPLAALTLPTASAPVYSPVCDTALGPVLLTSDGEHLTGLYLEVSDEITHRLHRSYGVEPTPENDLAIFADTEVQLREYFAGERR